LIPLHKELTKNLNKCVKLKNRYIKLRVFKT
jgi:hypothetical protein